MAFTPAIAPSSKQPRAQRYLGDKWSNLANALGDHYSFSTWLLIGGSLQALLAIIFGSFWVCLPVLLLLAARSLDTLAIIFKFKPNPYLEGAIHNRVAPQIPDSEGNFSSNAGSAKVAVFLLGFKVNDPRGIFAPYLQDIGTANDGLWKELAANAPDSGYYGSSVWTSRDSKGAVEILTISYWRSTEDIHEFAYGPSHKKIWDQWNKWDKEGVVKHLGINHEIFEVDAHRWEGVYLNFQPTMLGATTFLRKGDKDVGGVVEDQWVSALMDARKGKLRTSAGRLGRDPAALDGTLNGGMSRYGDEKSA